MNIEDLLGPILRAERPLRVDDSLDTLPSWDSTRQVDVILAIEDALGSDLTTSEIERVKSIRDVMELFRARGMPIELARGS